MLVSPAEHQVLSLSPNGKWACGIYSDYNYDNHAFRWNLESGEIEMLGNPTEESVAWNVCNDGTVVGRFTCTTIMQNGVGVAAPGYYRDGEWHLIEIPMGATIDDTAGKFYIGDALAVSEDGQYISGCIVRDYIYYPYVWKNGKVLRQLDVADDMMPDAMPYCISPDGMTVGGWSNDSFSRACTIWNTNDGRRKLISDYQFIDAGVDRFSTDGRKAILYGKTENGMRESIYDLQTGEMTMLPSSTVLYAMSNSYTAVGSGAGGAVMYRNGSKTSTNLTSYLRQQGADFTKYRIASIQRAQAISADDNTFVLIGSADDGAGYQDLCSIVVKLNADSEHSAPVAVGAKQLEGIRTTQLSWQRPLVKPETVKNFEISRDGSVVATISGTASEYYDRDIALGSHSYIVTAIYDDGTSVASQPAKVSIADKKTTQPERLFVRQKGMSDGTAEWEHPLSNLISKRWYNPENANLKGFGVGSFNVDIEMGIGFKASEMACYDNCQLTAVQFYPMTPQENLQLRVYKYLTPDKPTLVYQQDVTQPLTYKQRNTVKLDKPLQISGDADLVIAFGMHVPEASTDIIGIDFSHCTPGYGDLIRLAEEPDFYSFYNLSVAMGTAQYDTFIIDAILSPAGSADDADHVTHYDVTVDGKHYADVADTNAPGLLSTDFRWMENGTHTVGVAAVYADGRRSEPATAELNIKRAFKGIKSVNITQTDANSIHAEWQQPVDDDKVEMTYASGPAATTAELGPMGTAEVNYMIMAGVEYGPEKLRGYNGYTIESVRFYPTADAIFTFMIYDGDKQIAEFECDDYKLNQWNTVYLDEPLTIDASHTYYLNLDCYDVTPECAPLALDGQLPYVLVSDRVSVDNGTSWVSVADEGGMYGNWMLSMNLVNPDPLPAPVTGYNVLIDNRNVNTSPVLDTKYDCTDLDASKKHTLRINTYYEGRTSVVAGDAISFTLDKVDGISSVIADPAAGADLYDVAGRRIASPARGITITRLPDGNVKKQVK